jgi:hypothetical protein
MRPAADKAAPVDDVGAPADDRRDELVILPRVEFEIEPEITAKIARAKVRIYEVPISYTPRDHSNGKKIGMKDGVKALYSILYYRLKD